LFQRLGNTFYPIAIVLGVLTLVMVLVKGKQLLGYKKHLTTSVVLTGVSIFGIILHYLIYTNVYR